MTLVWQRPTKPVGRTGRILRSEGVSTSIIDGISKSIIFGHSRQLLQISDENNRKTRDVKRRLALPCTDCRGVLGSWYDGASVNSGQSVDRQWI